MNRIPQLARRRQGGMALLEALIAAVLLAIGLLGTVGLQASAYSALTEAGMRAEATIAAERLLGVMTTDTENLSAYGLKKGEAPGERLASWHKATSENIPGADITIVVAPQDPDGGPRKVDVTISWQRKADAPTNKHAVSAYL